MKTHGKHIFMAAAVVWMAVIFMNSSFNGNASSGVSEAIIGLLVSVFRLLGDGKTAVSIREILSSDSFHIFLRKSAHFIEFGILGMLVSGSMGCSAVYKENFAKDKGYPAEGYEIPAGIRTDSDGGEKKKTGGNCSLAELRRSIPGKILISTFICAMYAITDEIHQLFVPGRVCSPWDVMIDAAGAFVFSGAFLLICAYIRRKRMMGVSGLKNPTP